VDIRHFDRAATAAGCRCDVCPIRLHLQDVAGRHATADRTARGLTNNKRRVRHGSSNHGTSWPAGVKEPAAQRLQRSMMPVALLPKSMPTVPMPAPTNWMRTIGMLPPAGESATDAEPAHEAIVTVASG